MRRFLEARVDLLEQRNGGANPRRSIAKNVASDDDQRGTGQRERRIVERDQIGDADDRSRQRVVHHRHGLHRSPSPKSLSRDEVAQQRPEQIARLAGGEGIDANTAKDGRQRDQDDARIERRHQDAERRV